MDLRTELTCAINVLCLQCGKYEHEHEGACDGCRWKKDKDDDLMKPIQHDQMMRMLVSDLQDMCDGRCYDEEEDDEGEWHITWRCPFLEKGRDAYKASCLICEPYEWEV